MCRKLASASYANFDTLLKEAPKRVPKITSLNPVQAYFPGPPKIDFFEKVAKTNLLDNSRSLAPKAPYLKGSVTVVRIVINKTE